MTADLGITDKRLREIELRVLNAIDERGRVESRLREDLQQERAMARIRHNADKRQDRGAA